MPEYQLQIIRKNECSYSFEKPIRNLGNKKCKLNYKNLKLFAARIKIKKNERVIEFKQKAFLKPYIECNTKLQKQAEKEGNRFKTQNSKLRNNAIFG